MNRLKTMLRYAAALVLFILAYGILNFLARIVVTAINTNLHPLIVEYVVPYFVAGCAGYLGVAGALAVTESIFQSIRQRAVAWAFISLMVAFWGFLAIGMLLGVEPDPGIGPMAFQAVVAVIAAYKLSTPDAEPA